jgi:pimeloyl-ACP methyl ester carboxylesterase
MASSVKATGQLQNGHSTIFYEQEGSQDGPAILGIHGLGGTTNFFQPIVSSFQDYNVVRFDLSGHGRSAQDGANTKTSIATYVEDAVRSVPVSGEEIIFL